MTRPPFDAEFAERLRHLIACSNDELRNDFFIEEGTTFYYEDWPFDRGW
ncbi:MAG: hypothetical protein AAF517_11845 [Planctomycetota bacterium]